MNRKIMPILVCLIVASVASGVLALDSPPQVWFGTGTVTVTNVGPTMPSIGVNDTVFWATNIDVNSEIHFYVNVSDLNTIDDIKNVTIDINPPGFVNYDGATYHYRFKYIETTTNDSVISGSWTQVFTSSGPTYLNVASCVAPTNAASSTGTYVFSATLNKTASAENWIYYAKAYDSSGAFAEHSSSFNIYKYLEMSYSATSGLNFAWNSVTPGAVDVVAPFTVTVTANTVYSLSAAYENSFYNSTTGTGWGVDPSLEVNFTSKTTVTNYTISNATWYTSTGGGYQFVTSHKMLLDVPAVLPILNYTGVTIYIRASV